MDIETRTDEELERLRSFFDSDEDYEKDFGNEKYEKQTKKFEIEIKPVVIPFVLKAILCLISILVIGSFIYYFIISNFSVISEYILPFARFLPLEEDIVYRILQISLLFVSLVIPLAVFGGRFKRNLQIAFYLSMSSYFIKDSEIKVISHYPYWIERNIPYQNIVSVNVRKIPFRLFNTGDVIITLSDRSKVFLESIKKPEVIADKILKATQKGKK